MSIVCQRIARDQLQSEYGLKFPGHVKLTAHILLETFGVKRGYLGGHGHANEAKGARHILKDFVNVCVIVNNNHLFVIASHDLISPAQGNKKS